ncbi:prephenate dehydrogenase [Inhella gelatinilytica]|uniref:Prephenate dehydrogenase/arogenate dehydrogenase family protein n=1 Tax=Inhella gelatinilytica TaxID=2795030 RepID=A0A931NEM0_9BURK|nr:prephenate dehydrogenase/arogenate dehydrogenase family protein [Inhella gelatinilytica]MBH9553370.1 prephenate dehydrogenase/arogenate dehydrogenase family protein [Inhella gelatinilytica]
MTRLNRPQFQQLGIIGCGLIGGSFALALKRAGLVKRVVGYSKSPSTTEVAKKLGVIDVAAESALLAVSGSDLVLVAVPVSATEATLRAIRHLVQIQPQTLFMDVGSTKADVAIAAQKVLGDLASQFVPAHPIAGKEKAGVQNADALLFQGKQVVLTPLPENSAAEVQRAAGVWAALGCKVLKMTPENHDAAYAAVSHFPHLLSFAYFQSVMRQPSGREFMELAGMSFRDFTRIAGSDPAIWRDILLANRDEVLHQSQRFRSVLDRLEHWLKEGDAGALETLLRQVSEARAKWTPAFTDPDDGTPSSHF